MGRQDRRVAGRAALRREPLAWTGRGLPVNLGGALGSARLHPHRLAGHLRSVDPRNAVLSCETPVGGERRRAGYWANAVAPSRPRLCDETGAFPCAGSAAELLRRPQGLWRGFGRAGHLVAVGLRPGADRCRVVPVMLTRGLLPSLHRLWRAARPLVDDAPWPPPYVGGRRFVPPRTPDRAKGRLRLRLP